MPGTPKRRAKRAANAKALELATDEELRARSLDAADPKARIAMRAAILKGEASSNERLHLLARAALWDVVENAVEDKDRIAAARYLSDITKPAVAPGAEIERLSDEQLEREAREAEKRLGVGEPNRGGLEQ